jgi:hypothetical protein
LQSPWPVNDFDDFSGGKIMNGDFDVRILQNKHLAASLRKRLLSRNSGGSAVSEILRGMSDEQVVAAYLRDKAMAKDRATEKRSAQLTVL